MVNVSKNEAKSKVNSNLFELGFELTGFELAGSNLG